MGSNIAPDFLWGVSSWGQGTMTMSLPSTPGGALILGVVRSNVTLPNEPTGFSTIDTQGLARVLYMNVPAGGAAPSVTFNDGGGTFGTGMAASFVAYAQGKLDQRFGYAANAGNDGFGPVTAPSSKRVIALFAVHTTAFQTITCNPPLIDRTHNDNTFRWSATAIGDAIVTEGGSWQPSADGQASGEFQVWSIAFKAPQAPPCRQYPREDGLATSSAGRIFPQPRSQQGGIRRAGGTYY